MKWLPGDDYFQRAAEDGRYTISKSPAPHLYTAWFTPNGVGSWQRLSDPNPYKKTAMRAAQRHYEASTLRRAA